MSNQEQHQANFDRAFSFWPEEKRRHIFESHWNGSVPRHEHILALAADPRDLTHAQETLPGGPCPLCHFPTFEWADVSALPQPIFASLGAKFPHWTPDQGACKRCIEIYELAGKFEHPATILL